MRLGLIARADRSGLGVQSLEFFRAMQPERVLVIDVSQFADNAEHCNKFTDLSLYPGATVHKGWSPPQSLLVPWLRGLDAVFSCETFYCDELPDLAHGLGVKTVLQPNYEFLRPWCAPDLWAIPSMWHWDEIPEPKQYLPVPIALDRFGERRGYVNSGPRHFLHVCGRPAIHDRNGTGDLLGALQHVRSDVVLTIRCQNASYIQRLLSRREIPPNIELRVDATNVENYWSLYDRGDVMILPRRYGGLCLPANEALGAGMPVIMTDVSPNNQWLPAEWLVPATKTAEFMAFNRVDVYVANHVELAAKIDRFASDDVFFGAAKADAERLAKELSWDNLRGEYEKVLSG